MHPGCGRLGGDGKVRLAIADHLGDLLGRPLLHVQGHIGILAGEVADHRRQRVARLGVSGGDGEAPATLVAELLGHLLDVLGQTQHFAGELDDGLPGRRHPGQVLAAAGEDLHPQLILQQADLLGDPRLGGVEALGRGRNVEVMASDFPDVTQLLQLHGGELPGSRPVAGIGNAKQK